MKKVWTIRDLNLIYHPFNILVTKLLRRIDFQSKPFLFPWTMNVSNITTSLLYNRQAEEKLRAGPFYIWHRQYKDWEGGTGKFLRLHIIPHQRTANISISGFWISGGEFQSQSFSAFCVIYKRKVVLFNHRKWAERGGFEKILGNLFRLHNFADELIYTAAVRSPRPTTARELPSWNKNSKDTPTWSTKMLAVRINQAFTDLKFERCGRKLLETSKHTLPLF